MTPGTIVLAHGQQWRVISTTTRPAMTRSKGRGWPAHANPGAGVVAKVEHLDTGFVTYRHESELTETLR